MKKLAAIYTSQARLFARDRVTVLITVLLPLALSLFFGYVFGPSGSAAIRVVVVSQDASSSIVDAFTAATGPDLEVTTDAEATALAKLRDGDADVVVVLPAGFAERVAAGSPTTVTTHVNSGQNVSADMASLTARALVSDVARRLSASTDPVRFDARDVATKVPTLAEFYIPNFLAISMLWLSIFATALPLVRQRDGGCLLRTSIAPVSKVTFMAGVTLWRMTVGVAQSALFIAAAALMMGVAANWLPLVGGVLLGNLVFTVMGYMVAGLSRSVSSAEGIGQAFNFGFLFLSGVFFTPGMLPDAVNRIADAIPLAYLADLLRQMMVGYPASFPVWLDFAVLGGAGLVFSLLALKTWRWQ
jgi:ABC-2 type transport system permease protein